MIDASPLSAPVVPKVYRLRNKTGQEIGPYYTKVGKKPVNLRTQDYFKARDRAVEAVSGRKDFHDDRFFDDKGASVPQAPLDGAPSSAPAAPSGDWTADAVRAASAGLEPDAYFPPALPPMPQTESAGFGTEAKPETPKGPSIADESTTLPPEMLDNLVKQIAATVVELQIQGQEYLAIRWGKFQPGTVPPDSKARELPTAIWEAQIRKWIPTDVPLPAWIVAPVLCAMLTVPIQLEGATPLRTKPEPVA